MFTPTRYRMSQDSIRKNMESRWSEISDKIASHPEVWIYAPDTDKSDFDNQRPFEYVSEMFPKLRSEIRKTKCIVIENTYFWGSTLSLPQNAAGLYVPALGVILLARNYYYRLDLKDVLVHELLHRASHLLGHMSSEPVEEEFAFSYSIAWFAKKYEKDFIIEHYLMPYCTYSIMKSERKNTVNDKVLKEAKVLADRLYNFRTGEVIQKEPTSSQGVWDFL
jgi:hypothetical protein